MLSLFPTILFLSGLSFYSLLTILILIRILSRFEIAAISISEMIIRLITKVAWITSDMGVFVISFYV